MSWTIWGEEPDGKVSVRRAYEEAAEHTFLYDGHEWRMYLESNVVMVVERDGERHRIKCVLNSNPYAGLEYQIQKTQVKLRRYPPAWLVAKISAGFRDWDTGEWWTGDEKWPNGINDAVARELNDLWRVKPLNK